MSKQAAIVAGILLILIPTIEYGGRFLLSLILGGAPEFLEDHANAALLRAGHGHAGVLVLLALWAQLALDHVRTAEWFRWALRIGFLLAPMLMSGGFFATAAMMSGSGASTPSMLLYAGATILAVSTVTLGILLIGWRRTAAA